MLSQEELIDRHMHYYNGVSKEYVQKKLNSGEYKIDPQTYALIPFSQEPNEAHFRRKAIKDEEDLDDNAMLSLCVGYAFFPYK